MVSEANIERQANKAYSGQEHTRNGVIIKAKTHRFDYRLKHVQRAKRKIRRRCIEMKADTKIMVVAMENYVRKTKGTASTGQSVNCLIMFEVSAPTFSKSVRT